MASRKLELICTAGLILFILTGCGCSWVNEHGKISDGSMAESSTVDIAVPNRNSDFSKKIEFTFPRIDGEKAGHDPLYDILSKKFNVEISYIPMTWDNWMEKTDTWIASGDLPDILWWDLRAPQYAKYTRWCREGVFKEIPELTDKYPNLERLLKLIPELDKYNVDGRSYMIPHYTTDPEMEGVNGVSFYYRRDWAKKLGIDKDVFTFEDFKNYVKSCIEKDPGGNGQGNTLGVVGPTWAVPDHIFMLEESPYFASYVKKDGEYVWGAALPETLEGLMISQELYREGIIYKDFYTVNDLDGDSQFLNGKAAVLVGNIDALQLKDRRKLFKDNNPDEDPNMVVFPMKVLGPHGKTFIAQDYGFWSVSSFNPNIDDEKLERILTIMDWCCTDEAREYSRYGIKGKDWDIINGEFRQLWEKDVAGVAKRPYYMDVAHVYFNMGTNGGGFSFSKDLSLSREEKEDTIDWVTWRKSVPQSVQKLDPDLDFLFAMNKSKYGSFAQDVKDEAKRLIIGSDNISVEWDAWLKYMKPKVDPILKEINDALVK